MGLTNEAVLDTHGLEELAGARIAVIGTEWNDPIVSELRNGCQEVAASVGANIILDLTVPGAVELPFACSRLHELTRAMQGRPEAIVALGAVIKGGTPHFEYVCDMVTKGISQLNITLPIPVIFGVLTLNTEAEAWERLGGMHGHKGREAMLAALKMIRLNRNITRLYLA